MAGANRDDDTAIREAAYFIWEREGRPEGRAQDHWLRALREGEGQKTDPAAEPMWDEEKVLAGRPDVNMTALLTKDVLGG
jgi:hypothetical protein